MQAVQITPWRPTWKGDRGKLDSKHHRTHMHTASDIRTSNRTEQVHPNRQVDQKKKKKYAQNDEISPDLCFEGGGWASLKAASVLTRCCFLPKLCSPIFSLLWPFPLLLSFSLFLLRSCLLRYFMRCLSDSNSRIPYHFPLLLNTFLSVNFQGEE